MSYFLIGVIGFLGGLTTTYGGGVLTRSLRRRRSIRERSARAGVVIELRRAGWQPPSELIGWDSVPTGIGSTAEFMERQR